MDSQSQLFAKYDVPAPRYTSYPTVPYWKDAPTQQEWFSHLKKGLFSSAWSMYIHIPFCESLCTFCGCNNIITKDHQKESPYVTDLLTEWALYTQSVPELKTTPLQNLHLGGGTPTFLSAMELERLLMPILKSTTVSSRFEGSIEVDPRRTDADQLRVLRDLGFSRVSLGVQDFNPEIQRLVNRNQSFEETKKITEVSRELGYSSINFDLIYGLARQTIGTMKETIEKTKQLRPDRIALYSFALVPWIKPAQRLFKDEDLPTGKEKRALYEFARTELLNSGYVEVGMDHFALKEEALSLALKKKTLHRNFMGYTDQRTEVMLGLGVSSISETPDSFHQNEKVLTKYQELLKKNKIPTSRGHVHSLEDKIRRSQILTLMTTSEVNIQENQVNEAHEFLAEMLKDGLVQLENTTLKITDKGKPFLRNLCLFFDEHLKKNKPETRLFSQSV